MTMKPETLEYIYKDWYVWHSMTRICDRCEKETDFEDPYYCDGCIEAMEGEY